MTPDPAIATAADYADALITARRAKNLIVLLLLLLLLVQLAVFFVAKYTDVVIPSGASAPTAAATNSSAQTTASRLNDAMHYLTGLAAFLGIAFSIVLSMVVYLLVKIMLVGRLIGVARLTGAFLISLIVIVLLFPWQAFLGGDTFRDASFKIPGVLYTWGELQANAKFGVGATAEAAPAVPQLVLHWARFVVWPVVAVVLLLMIQAKSNRGLRQALGEDTLIDSGDPGAAGG